MKRTYNAKCLLLTYFCLLFNCFGWHYRIYHYWLLLKANFQRLKNNMIKWYKINSYNYQGIWRKYPRELRKVPIWQKLDVRLSLNIVVAKIHNALREKHLACTVWNSCLGRHISNIILDFPLIKNISAQHKQYYSIERREVGLTKLPTALYDKYHLHDQDSKCHPHPL